MAKKSISKKRQRQQKEEEAQKVQKEEALKVQKEEEEEAQTKKKVKDTNEADVEETEETEDISEEEEDETNVEEDTDAEMVEAEDEVPEVTQDVEETEEAEETEPTPETSPIAPTLTPARPFTSDGKYRNKQRCLLLCSRGVTARYRHLLEDLRTFIPHNKRDSKLDPGEQGIGAAVNEIAQVKSCNSFLFVECRKRQDCYFTLGHTPRGPSARFLVNNVHTMDELRLTGNCMRGSRPVLNFDESFESVPHLRLLKELFIDVFGTPRGHPKSKPFVDRIMGFYYADKKIWVRNYQIIDQQAQNAKDAHAIKKQQEGANSAPDSIKGIETNLVEIGPRFVMTPIRIFAGSFGGQTLYLNDDYVSPNTVRAAHKSNKGNAYESRKFAQASRKDRGERIVVPEDPLDDVFR